MKYQLSNCEIKQLSENVFEATPKKGIVVDKNCAEQCYKLWNDIRNKPFGLLVNCRNLFSRSFEGARDMGKHPLQQQTALLIKEDDYHHSTQLRLALQIKEMSGYLWNHKVFTDKAEAIEWLSDS
jgi:hypothetical protein